MASILMISLIIVGGLGLWFVVALFVARTTGRVASAGEHHRQMDLLHWGMRPSRAAGSSGARRSSAYRPSH